MTGRAKQADDGGTRLSSVANAILLMKTFSDDQSELGISALADRLGLAKSTVHRLASTVLARLAGFLAGRLDLREDPLRSSIEALMAGYDARS